MKYTAASIAAASALILAASPAAATDVSVTPRAWLLFDSLSGGDFVADGTNASFSFNSPPFQVLMKGASVALRSDGFAPNTTFTVTGLFGSDTKTLTTRGSTVNPVAPNFQQIIFTLQNAGQRLKRQDYELSAQTRINDLVSWVAGVRYERARVRFSPTVTSTSSNPFTGQVQTVTTVVPPFDGGYDLYSARIGAAIAVPLSEAGNDLIYGNAMAFIGRREEKNPLSSPVFDNATLLGPDVSLGYVHRFSPNISFDIRYRALFFFSIGGGGRFSDPKSTHGPNAGLTIRF